MCHHTRNYKFVCHWLNKQLAPPPITCYWLSQCCHVELVKIKQTDSCFDSTLKAQCLHFMELINLWID